MVCWNLSYFDTQPEQFLAAGLSVSYDKPDLFFKGRDSTGLILGSSLSTSMFLGIILTDHRDGSYVILQFGMSFIRTRRLDWRKSIGGWNWESRCPSWGQKAYAIFPPVCITSLLLGSFLSLVHDTGMCLFSIHCAGWIPVGSHFHFFHR